MYPAVGFYVSNPSPSRYVHLQVRWNLIRRSTLRAKRPACLKKKPVKSAMKNTSSTNLLMNGSSSSADVTSTPDPTSVPGSKSTPDPDSTPAATSTPTGTPTLGVNKGTDSAAPSPKPGHERRLSRFSIKRVDEDMKQAVMAVQQRRKEEPATLTVEAEKMKKVGLHSARCKLH